MTSPHPSHLAGEPGLTVVTFWKSRWLIAICTAMGGAIGGAYLSMAPPQYEVAARVLVESHDKPTVAGRARATDRDFLPTQAEIIRSPAVIQQAVANTPEALAYEVDPVTEIYQRLRVEPLLGTSVLSLRFESKDPRQAVGTLTAVIDSYKSFLQNHEQTSHRETIVLLTEREQELRGEIARLQGEYDVLHREGPLVGQDDRAAESQRALLTNLNTLLSTVQSRRIQLETYLTELVSLNQATAQAGPPSGQTVLVSKLPATPPLADYALGLPSETSTAVELLSRLSVEGLVSVQDPQPIKESLLAARIREAELTQRFGNRHPEVKAVRGSIDSLEERLQSIVSSAPSMLEREAASIRSHEAKLTAAYEEEFQRAKVLDGFLLREQHAIAEIQRVQATHESVMTQLNEVRLADEALSGGRASITVRVLDGPIVNDDKTWPAPKPVLMMSLIIGLVMGCVVVVGKEQLGLYFPSGDDE